ncbi:hypothetical protein VPHD148_0302 [Vibrio phage D148]
MPLHIIKKVSELVPDTAALVKRASLESNLPTNSKEETLLSALELEYMIKVAHSHVDLEDAERVCRAVDLYGIGPEVKDKASSMIKAASDQASRSRELKTDVNQAINFIDSQLLSMNPDLEKIAEASERLWDEFSDHIDSDQVKLYAGAGTLVKEAAVMALNHRAKRTGNDEFEKVAHVVAATNPESLSVEDNRSIVSAIRELEKQSHYVETDLYTDIFMTKEASVMVNLGSKSVDATNLVKIAGHAGDVLGSDIGQLLKQAGQNKAAIEALPMGERQVLEGLV